MKITLRCQSVIYSIAFLMQAFTVTRWRIGEGFHLRRRFSTQKMKQLRRQFQFQCRTHSGYRSSAVCAVRVYCAICTNVWMVIRRSPLFTIRIYTCVSSFVSFPPKLNRKKKIQSKLVLKCVESSANVRFSSAFGIRIQQQQTDRQTDNQRHIICCICHFRFDLFRFN